MTEFMNSQEREPTTAVTGRAPQLSQSSHRHGTIKGELGSPDRHILWYCILYCSGGGHFPGADYRDDEQSAPLSQSSQRQLGVIYLVIYLVEGPAGAGPFPMRCVYICQMIMRSQTLNASGSRGPFL